MLWVVDEIGLVRSAHCNGDITHLLETEISLILGQNVEVDVLVDLGPDDVGSYDISGVPVQLLVHGVLKGLCADITGDGGSI